MTCSREVLCRPGRVLMPALGVVRMIIGMIKAHSIPIYAAAATSV